MSTRLHYPFVGGKPDVEAIRNYVPKHGEGELEHTALSGDKFRFHIQPNAQLRYEVFIKQTPSYRDRPADAHSTHRWNVGTPRERICIKEEFAPRDLPTAVALAMWWAECTSRYIADGRPWAGGAT